MRASVAALSLMVGIALPVSARAGNDDEMLVGNRASMTGGAVMATVSDASSTWYNPAGLGVDSRGQIDVSATAYNFRSYSVPRFLSTTSGAYKDGAVSEFVSVPTQIAYVRRITSGWSLGLGYFVPHISNFVLREGLGDDPARGSQWQVSASIADTLHTAAAAMGGTIAPGVRLGVSLVGGYGAITQSVSLFAAVNRDGQSEAIASGAYFATSTRLSLESGVGLQWDAAPNLTLGLSCRTPRLQLYRDTDVSFNETYARAGTPPAIVGVANRPQQAETGFHLIRAGRAGLALAYRFGSGWAAGEFDVQPAIHKPAADVDRKAVLNARFGVYQRVTRSVALGGGVFTDRSPDAVRYSLLSGSGDFYGANAGVEISHDVRLAPTEPVDTLVFSTVFALRYAFSNGDFGRPVGDPNSVSIETGPFQVAKGVLRVHELAFYVGSGLHF